MQDRSMFTHCSNLLSATVTLGKPSWSRPPQTSSFPAVLGAGHGHWSHQQTSEDHRTAPDGEKGRKRERRLRVRNWRSKKKKKKKHSVKRKDAQMYLLRKTAASMSKNSSLFKNTGLVHLALFWLMKDTKSTWKSVGDRSRAQAL